MLIDRYGPEDVVARVPELADQTDPVLMQLDHLLDDDQLYMQVRGDLARRYPLTPARGRHSTPAEVLLRLLVVQHLYAWSYEETVERVADSLVRRWFCRDYFRRVPTAFGHHRAIVGRPPSLVTGDRRLHAKGLKEAARRLGVRHLAIPWTGRLGAARQAVEQDQAWRWRWHWRYRWRAGIEGRIHSLRRDDGLRRCRSHGEIGLQRDVGWGLLANNLHRIATAGVAHAVRLEADHGRAA